MSERNGFSNLGPPEESNSAKPSEMDHVKLYRKHRGRSRVVRDEIRADVLLS